MSKSLTLSLVIAAVLATAVPVTAQPVTAQPVTNRQSQPGYTTPDYGQYRGTGVPSGSFTLPTVGLQRREVAPRIPADQPPTFKATTQPLPAEPAREASPSVGKVKTVSEPPKSQSGSSGAAAVPTASQPQRYVKGMTFSGRGKAYDGHSLVVDGHAVRLDGADAPGLVQTCQTHASVAWRCGESAYRRLSSLVDGKKVTCRVEEQVGEGAAAVCSVQGVRDLAEALVREGLAVPNGHDEGRYAASAQAARNSRSGMWVGSFQAPWLWRAGTRG